MVVFVTQEPMFWISAWATVGFAIFLVGMRLNAVERARGKNDPDDGALLVPAAAWPLFAALLAVLGVYALVRWAVTPRKPARMPPIGGHPGYRDDAGPAKCAACGSRTP